MSAEHHSFNQHRPMAAIFDADVLHYVEASVLCWLATVDPDGMPSVSPKEVFCAYGDSELLIANIASPRSVRNLRANPNACVSFVDVFVQKGFKLQGTCTVVDRDHRRFPELVRPLELITKGVYPILSVICLHVARATPVHAPSYRMVSGTTEESQARNALASYQWPRKRIDG